MSSLKTTLIVSSICVLAANVAIGCSASSDPFTPGGEDPDGSPPVVVPDSGDEQDEDTGAPPRDSGKETGSDASSDAAKEGGDGGTDASDAGSDAAPEAGPDAAADAGGPTGSPCAPLDQIQRRTCGFCGTQARLCAPESNAPDAPLVWQEWGFCQNEVENGCMPGTETTEACGLCGSRAKVCQNNCRWAVGSCKGEPANACAPGTLDYQEGLSCDVNGRERTCGADCRYGNFGACIEDDDTDKLTLSGTAGGLVSGEYSFVATAKIPRLSTTSACPSTLSTTSTSYKYVTLVNPTASTLLVTVGSAKSTISGSSDIDTVLTAYRSSIRPRNDAMRLACWKAVIDGCTTDGDFCKASWAGLVGANRLEIPPNGRAVIYTAVYSATTVGNFRLLARTDTVTP